MLQNRVDPFGKFIRTPARGLWMGNRGVIHADHEITRPFRHKAWITCVLQFKDRKRTVMSPGRWTELFFLDEVTAFAAGHRPCFECRREAAIHFKQCWLRGNSDQGFHMKTSVALLDEIIHRERINRGGEQVTHNGRAGDLPEGAFILFKTEPFLVSKDRLHRWTPFGYKDSIALPPANSIVTILTPQSILNAFRAGYVPQPSL